MDNSTIKLALVTMNSRQDYKANMKAASNFIEEASENGSNWVMLPEMFPVLGNSEKIREIAKAYSDDILEEIRSWAKDFNITLFAGSVPEYVSGEDKCFNTSYVISPKGEVLKKYRKIHLFELNDENGSKIISEKDNYLAGSELARFELDGWKLGLAICYDLRFPSMFEKLSEREDLDAIIIPAAFTDKTGEAHWELLLRARAVEQQCFVIATNQVGKHSDVMESLGIRLL